MEDLVGIEGHNAVDPAQRANRMRGYFDDGSNIANWSVWTALDTYLIIKEEWGWDPITQAFDCIYTLPAAEVPATGDEEFNACVTSFKRNRVQFSSLSCSVGIPTYTEAHTIRLPIYQSG